MSADQSGVDPDAVDSSLPVPQRSWGDIAGEVALVLPNMAKLLTRLMRDPRVPIRRKMLVGAVIGYVVLPIDVIPDFLIGIGRLDDVILVSLAVDHLMRGADEVIVIEHWDGSIDSLDMVRSLFAWGAGILPDGARRVLPR